MTLRKYLPSLSALIIFLFSTAFIKGTDGYNEELVEVSTAVFKSDKFHVISLNRQNKRIHAKYFAATDPHNNKSVSERYLAWKKGKNIIAVSSGTYMTSCIPAYAKPVGLCIDNGIIVNNSMDTRLGGLVIVSQTGSIVATKISDGNLTIHENGENKQIDINKTFDRNHFVNWAKNNDATVFQSHLLVYEDKLNTSPCTGTTKSCSNKASRRFLAVGFNENNERVHIIIHSPSETTLYDGTYKVFKFLKEFKEMRKISFMINLDTGCQDVFNFYHTDGSKTPKIKGTLDEHEAVNLLIYHYE